MPATTRGSWPGSRASTRGIAAGLRAPTGSVAGHDRQATALITGITGQDGSYLAELLLEQGLRGARHGAAGFDGEVRPHRAPARPASRCTRATCSTSARSSTRCARRSPSEIYNLAAMSFVAVSWVQPTLTAEFTGVGVTRMLEAMREVCPQARFYQASSSEMFGKVPRGAADRADALLPALALRRGEGVRAFHHGQLPRELRPARDERNPVQPRDRRAAGWSS